MTQRLVVTGASGISAPGWSNARGRAGAAMTARCRGGSAKRRRKPNCTGATAVIHLGHAWSGDAEHGTGPGNVNLQGAVDLCECGEPRRRRAFRVASTTSARAEALEYLWADQVRHRRPAARRSRRRRCVSLTARIALVYGGPEKSLFGLLSRVTALLPAVPMIRLSRELQPIHLDEVCDGLLKLALDPPASGDTFVLGSPRTERSANGCASCAAPAPAAACS